MTTPRNVPVSQTPETAKAVAEYLLDQTGSALRSGNFDQFEDCFFFPHEIDTMEGRRLMATPQDGRETFKAVCAHNAELGVTDMVRHVLEASFQDEDTIVTTHETRLVRGDVLIQKPYPVFSIVKRIGEKWKITYSQYAIVDTDSFNKTLMGAGG